MATYKDKVEEFCSTFNLELQNFEIEETSDIYFIIKVPKEQSPFCDNYYPYQHITFTCQGLPNGSLLVICEGDSDVGVEIEDYAEYLTDVFAQEGWKFTDNKWIKCKE